MMRIISSVRANDDWTLDVIFADGAERRFDVKSLLNCEAFAELRTIGMFRTVRNGGYFVEWENEADLSADTLYLEGVSSDKDGRNRALDKGATGRLDFLFKEADEEKKKRELREL